MHFTGTNVRLRLHLLLKHLIVKLPCIISYVLANLVTYSVSAIITESGQTVSQYRLIVPFALCCLYCLCDENLSFHEWLNKSNIHLKHIVYILITR